MQCEIRIRIKNKRNNREMQCKIHTVKKGKQPKNATATHTLAHSRGLRDLKVGKTNKCPSMNGLDPSLNAVLKTV